MRRACSGLEKDLEKIIFQDVEQELTLWVYGIQNMRIKEEES